MSDLLREAWYILEPGERPKGMGIYTHPGGDRWLGDLGGARIEHNAARDHLIVAVEEVLLVACGRTLTFNGSTCNYAWSANSGFRLPYPDRLAAAVAALKAERGGA